jgi:hypothetical protein
MITVMIPYSVETGNDFLHQWRALKNIFKLMVIPQWRTILSLLIFLTVFHMHVAAQQKTDSTIIEKVNANKTIKKLTKLISRTPEVDKPLLEKSENSYLIHAGKIIRKIEIKRIGFETSVLDTTQAVKSFFIKTANKLHANTRESVIRNNLFVREGKPLNPYRLADNERSLRNLDFMLDARIYIKRISKNSDSVDILVVTRDVFAYGGSVGAQLPSLYRAGIKNINVGGLGQRMDFKQVLDHNRTPYYGFEGLYQMTNVKGSFIDATIAYTKLNTGVSIGNENERAIYFKLNRELYQPFTRFAGAIELSDNLSRNVYTEPDSTFIQYHYKIQDYWLGYSFGYKKLPNNLKENRNRKFIAVRGFQQYFINPTYTLLTEPDNFAYRNRAALLGQLTFFRQDFYKTQYVLGFGRTEDIPYGYRISFTTGVERELGNERPYAGSEFYYNKVLVSGTILSYSVKMGAYWSDGHLEDQLVSLEFTRYSKIQRLGRMIMRHQYEAGYAVLFNQAVKRGFNIRDANGLIGFRPDSLVGLQRITLSEETILFTPWKFMGFNLAAIARIDAALIKIGPGLFRSRNFFTGISLGLRVRNENLIFNTIEARAFYYPVTVEDLGHFRLTLTSNFRIKYPTNLVNKPSTAFP